MDFRPINWLPLLAGVLMAATFSVAGQGVPSSGQPILYSTPAGDAALGPAFSGAAADQSSFADELSAPAPVFSQRPSMALPAPFSPPSQNDLRFNKLLQDRKNWALMTPEEIMGVTTPEKILGLPSADDAAQSSLSPEQRFIVRQSQSASSATNGGGGFFGSKENTPRWLLQQNLDDADDSSLPNYGNPSPLANPSRMLSAPSKNNPFAPLNADSDWIRPPPAASFDKPTPEQAAAMDRFRELIGSDSGADKPVKPSPGYNFISSPDAPPDPNLKPQPIYNPAGASYSVLGDNISKPSGITPLPGVTSQPFKTESSAPSWAPKPPPWLSQEPNPFAPSQRVF